MIGAVPPAAIAQQMSDCRAEVKELCRIEGLAYEDEVRAWRDLITAAMKAHGCTEVRAVLRLQDDLAAAGKFTPIAGALIVAAALDLIDARQASPKGAT